MRATIGLHSRLKNLCTLFEKGNNADSWNVILCTTGFGLTFLGPPTSVTVIGCQIPTRRLPCRRGKAYRRSPRSLHCLRSKAFTKDQSVFVTLENTDKERKVLNKKSPKPLGHQSLTFPRNLFLCSQQNPGISQFC